MQYMNHIHYDLSFGFIKIWTLNVPDAQKKYWKERSQNVYRSDRQKNR